MLFAPGQVSTDAIEFAPAFSRAGTELFFSRADPTFAFTILTTRVVGRRWSEVRPATFSARHSRLGASVFTPDGSRLFFESSRPVEELGGAAQRSVLCIAEPDNGSWNEARCFDAPATVGASFWNPSPGPDGFVYFHAPRDQAEPRSDIFSARLDDDGLSDVANLGELNAAGAVDAEPTIAPDGSYMVFYSAGRPDQLGEGLLGDLYVSFRRPDGSWRAAVSLGPGVNSAAEENWPEITPDGRFLFFSSARDSANGFPDIYWVSTEVVEALR